MSILERLRDPSLLSQMNLGEKLWGSVVVMIIGMVACMVALTAIMYAIKLMHLLFREKKPAVADGPAAAQREVPADMPDPSRYPAGSLVVASPCEGTVKALNASVGVSVREGDVLLLLEAFGEVQELLAPEDGVVRQLPAKAGGRVRTGEALVVM